MSISIPEHNYILAALPRNAKNRIFHHLEPVKLKFGDVLHEPGGKIHNVFFLTTAIASLLNCTRDGSSAETAVVGREGMLGIGLLMGGNNPPVQTVILRTGDGFRLKARYLKEEFNRGGQMMHLLLCYMQGLMTQMSQVAVCNRHHSVSQQLCRWLLMNLDRQPANSLVMTQELIAAMLGVRREGVTEAAGKLQRDGLIRYKRGHITVLDRVGLEARVCECYQVVSSECARLLPIAMAV